MSMQKDSVDFDFFDTPREEQKTHFVPQVIVKKRPPPPKKGGMKNGHVSESSDSYTSDSDSVTDSSGSEDETARSRDYKQDNKNKPVVVTKKYVDSDGSSSAYSYGSSDEDFEDDDDSPRKNKTNVSSTKQGGQKQAWNVNGSSNTSSNNHVEKDFRPKSAKFRDRPKESSQKRSKSDSDSEITDVSPLNSPRSTPTKLQKQGQDKVQYSSSQTQSGEGEIQLESDKIDLKLLMDAVSEIDKQERLKANSRRVMFAPPKTKGGGQGKNHYSFNKDRISTIEKENERLLRQIMQHIGPKEKRKQPREVPHPVPRIDRLTSSAVNRRREQSKIEQENLKFLNRLQKTKATRGLSRKEQLDQYSNTYLYGVPIAAVHEHMAAEEGLNSTYMRSTSSLNSTHQYTQGRRSRPSSAKSNASSMRPGSAKSTMSTASRVSRPGSAKSSFRSIDNRPQWNDRFSFS